MKTDETTNIKMSKIYIYILTNTYTMNANAVQPSSIQNSPLNDEEEGIIKRREERKSRLFLRITIINFK